MTRKLKPKPKPTPKPKPKPQPSPARPIAESKLEVLKDAGWIVADDDSEQVCEAFYVYNFVYSGLRRKCGRRLSGIEAYLLTVWENPTKLDATFQVWDGCHMMVNMRVKNDLASFREVMGLLTQLLRVDARAGKVLQIC